MRSIVKVRIRLPLHQLPTSSECGAEILEFESIHFRPQQYKHEILEDPLIWSLALMIHLYAITANLAVQDIRFLSDSSWATALHSDYPFPHKDRPCCHFLGVAASDNCIPFPRSIAAPRHPVPILTIQFT